MASQTYQIDINEETYQLEVGPHGQQISLDGKAVELDFRGNAEQGFHLIVNQKSYRVQVIEADYESKELLLEVNDKTIPIKGADRFDLLLKDLGMEHLAGAAVNDLKAPMPGLVLEIKVADGDTVKKGQALCVLEAMKMENVLKSESDGVIKSIQCQKGAAVEKNQVLIEFEA